MLKRIHLQLAARAERRRMAPRALVVTLLAVTGAACGARSALEITGGGDGAQGGAATSAQGGGGHGGATTSAGGGGPGGSGGSVSCGVLAITEPERLDALLDVVPRDPWLLPVLEGGALLLTRDVQMESPGPVPSPIGALRIHPWDTWPPTIEERHQATPDSDAVPFKASLEPGGTFALGVERFPKDAGCDLGALFGLSPALPPGPLALAIPVNGTCDDVPAGVATAVNGDHFFANDLALNDGSGMFHRILVAHALDPGGAPTFAPPPQCASTFFAGDVLPWNDGFLFAHSAADQDGCLSPPDVPPGPARRVVVRRVSAVGEVASVVYKGVDELVEVRLVARTSGAWLFVRESGASAFVQPPGMAALLADDGTPGPFFEVTEIGAGPMAVTALGDGFAVAFTEATDPSAPAVFMRAYSAAGELRGAAAFSTNGAFLGGDRVALVGSPSGASVLVGWVGVALGEGPQMFLRRIDCIAGTPPNP